MQFSPKENPKNHAVMIEMCFLRGPGLIESRQWASHWDYLSLAFHQIAVIWELESTVEWSYGESREKRQAVEVSSHRYRRCFNDESVPLPLGWSRRPAAIDAIHDGKSATQNENNSLAMHDHFVHVGFPGINFGYLIPYHYKREIGRTVSRQCHSSYLAGHVEDILKNIASHLCFPNGLGRISSQDLVPSFPYLTITGNGPA